MKLSAKPSGVSLHFEKHKGTPEINGLQRHNERTGDEGESHSNERIDPERTRDNVFLKRCDGTYYQDIERIISEQRKGGLKGVRKTAVRMVEATVQLSGQVLEQDDAYMESVLRDSYKWLEQTFGRENVVSATIHKDETNMHLHFDFVPMKDNRLTAKEVLSRGNLVRYQSDFLAYLQKEHKTMNFGRKESNEFNGLPQDVFEAVQEERKALSDELEQYEEELNGREDVLNDREELLDQERQRLDADAKKREKLHRTKAGELATREKNLDTYKNKLDDKTKELKILQLTLEKREKAVEGIEDKANALDARESLLREREKDLKGRERFLQAKERALKAKDKELAAKEEKLLKTQNTASESIEVLNALLAKAKTPITRERLKKKVEKVKPVTDAQELELTAEMLKALADSSRTEGLSL